MKTFSRVALSLALALLLEMLAGNAEAQQRGTTAAQPVAASVQAAAPSNGKCLRALNGACTNEASVEAARRRAMIIPAVTVSYLGTPAGSLGGPYIRYERIFQDNPLIYGLPTNILIQTCCVTRTK
jgi:hypothetical protein